MRNFTFILLILVSPVSIGGGGFNIEDCKGVLSSSDKVSYPQVILELKNAMLFSDVSNMKGIHYYEELKYPKRENIYSRIDFAKIEANHRNELMMDLAKFWKVDVVGESYGYWGAIVYFIKRLGEFSSLNCDLLDESSKLDIIVLSSFSAEVLPSKYESAKLWFFPGLCEVIVFHPPLLLRDSGAIEP